jgi:hypothetical protein
MDKKLATVTISVLIHLLREQKYQLLLTQPYNQINQFEGEENR